MQEIIVIIGPTGIGKTRLSIELAKRLDAEIINGDSVAIYKRLDIGSAKPTLEEQENIPHHLIDIREVDEDYSVFNYQQDARKKIEEITNRNKRVIIVGGTGLYIKAALYNYNFIENKNSNSFSDLSNEELLANIKKYPESTKLEKLPDLNNRQRLVRLLNKLENNEPLENKKDELLYPVKIIALTAPRDVVYSRINSRVDMMLNNGLLDEILSLKDYYKKSRILNSGIGYKEFADYLFKNKPLEEVVEEVKKDSRHFAKRQYTFNKHQFNAKWIEVDLDNFNNTVETVYNYIKKGS